MKNGKIFKELIINEISDFCRQYQYLQLEKPSGVEVEIPVHKALAMDLLKGGPTGPPLGLKRIKYTLGLVGLRTFFTIPINNFHNP